MGTTLTVIDLAGTIALLLWGLHMVQTGVQRAFGAELRRGLAVALGNRFAAFACSLGVTAILQSSTATGLMVSSFAAAGLVDLVPALGAMLGANVGTTLIVQLLSFDVSRMAALAILLGVMMFRRATRTRVRDLGRVAIGLGLMLMALHALLVLVTPFEDVPSLRLLLGMVATDPVTALLAAAAFTWASHSSVATVLLVMSFAEKGVVPPGAALAMVLGCNLGTAINPLLEGAAGGEGRRLPVGNLVNRVVGAVAVLAMLDRLGPFLAARIDDPAREVAIFHTAFNLVMAALFLPVLGPFARLLRRAMPAPAVAPDPAQPLYLESAGEVPAVALAGAVREALRMADTLDALLADAMPALRANDRHQLAGLNARRAVLERLDSAIRAHVGELDPDGLSEDDASRAVQVCAFTAHLDAAADLLARAALLHASRRSKRGLPFPAAEQAATAAVLARLRANLRAAGAVLLTRDGAAARALVGEKEAFRRMEAEAEALHTAALRDAQRDGQTGAASLHVDLVRDLKRFNAHLVAAAAYPVLEAEGALLPTRLRSDDGS